MSHPLARAKFTGRRRRNAGTEIVMRVEPEQDSSRAVERALDILEALAATRAPVCLSTVARTTQFPESTTYRLLGALLKRGFVSRDGLEYSLGPRIGGLAGTRTSLERLHCPLASS
jgi:hypothetical protein